MKLFDFFDFTELAQALGFVPLFAESSEPVQVTPLASQPANMPGGDGFVTREMREMVKVNGTTVRVKAGTKLYITRPGTLYLGSEVGGQRAKGIYVLVGLRSPLPRYATGYMALSNIANPTNTQSRVSQGAEAQETFAERLQAAVGGLEVISTAPMSSQAPDVIAKVGNALIQVEIKGRNSQTSHITFFDRSIRRGSDDQTLNDVAVALTNGASSTFEQMVDAYRKINPAVGFPGDEGAPPSGKLPPEFRVRDNPELFARVRADLIDHFAASGDNYFAVVNRDSGATEMFWTGVGANPLKAPMFPDLVFVVLDTYGGAYKGAMRVALKVQLEPSARGLRI